MFFCSKRVDIGTSSRNEIWRLRIFGSSVSIEYSQAIDDTCLAAFVVDECLFFDKVGSFFPYAYSFTGKTMLSLIAFKRLEKQFAPSE